MQQTRSSLHPPMLSGVGRGWNGIELMQYTGYVDEIVAPPLPDHIAAVYLGRLPPI